MRKTKIYLDTSIISFLYADDTPELRAITEDFFQNYVRTGLYEVYISEVVLAEIQRTVDPPRRAELLGAIEAYPMRQLEIREEIGPLALEYITSGVIPATRMNDARHVAVATYHEMDILLSWNFKHLANIKKQTGVKAVNERNGYFHPLLLTNPMEVLYEHN